MVESALVVKGTVAQMLERGAAIGEIGALLDALDHDARWDQLKGLGRAQQRKLYDASEGAGSIDLQHFVPADADDLQPVRHHGRNTLPIPGLSFFSKVFTRRADGAIIGFNADSPVGPLVGPGYFTALMSKESWKDRGEVVVDYYQVPVAGPVPAGWPWLRPNWLGIQLFVYFQTRDFMRKVSDHVSIGAAYKWDAMKMDHYFILCRED
jgi:hypothetical protein